MKNVCFVDVVNVVNVFRFLSSFVFFVYLVFFIFCSCLFVCLFVVVVFKYNKTSISYFFLEPKLFLFLL